MVGSLAFPQAESPAQWYSFGCLPVPGAANRVETSLAKEADDFGGPLAPVVGPERPARGHRRLIVLSLRCGKERNAESVHDITDVLARPRRLAAVALEDRPSISGGGVRDGYPRPLSVTRGEDCDAWISWVAAAWSPRASHVPNMTKRIAQLVQRVHLRPRRNHSCRPF
jgi:hypothetical protein